MLCTVIWDTYRHEERQEVLEALESLLPEDGPDWSRKGVYAYWDPATHELLYLGLANDLPKRFSQHNGLVAHGGGNKWQQIEAWLQAHGEIGLTIMIQAAAVQLMDLLHEISFSLGTESSEIIALGEGQLIELHRKQTGRRPKWNRVGGSRHGAELAIDSGSSLIPLLAAERDNLFVARRSLRALVADSQAMAWEATLHGARMQAVLAAHDIRGLPRDVPDVPKRVEQSLLVRAGHLVDDLSPTDADVIEWLRRIEDGRADLEVLQLQSGLTELGPQLPLPHDREAAFLLSAIAHQADFSTDARNVTDMLAARYLMDSPLQKRG